MGITLSSCLAMGTVLSFVAIFLPTVERDVNTIKPKAEVSGKHQIPVLPLARGMGPRGRRLRKWRARRQGLWGTKVSSYLLQRNGLWQVC